MGRQIVSTIDPASGLHFASAGTHAWPGAGATAEAVFVVAELGADLTRHQPRQLTSDLVADSDLIICMTNQHLRAVKALDRAAPASLLHADETEVDDPYGMSVDYYRQIRDEIAAVLEEQIPEWING